jgi:hypothetical protein
MHEFQNRPTTGISDCPGCARSQRGVGRTRGHSYSRRSLPGADGSGGVWVALWRKAVCGHRSASLRLCVSDGRCGSDGWEAGISGDGSGTPSLCSRSRGRAARRIYHPHGMGGGSGRVRRAWPGPADLDPVFGKCSRGRFAFQGGPPDDRAAAPRRACC